MCLSIQFSGGVKIVWVIFGVECLELVSGKWDLKHSALTSCCTNILSCSYLAGHAPVKVFRDIFVFDRLFNNLGNIRK